MAVAENIETISLPDTTFNPVRVNPPEGQMMAVMNLNKDGDLDRIVHSVDGWHFKGEERGFIPGTDADTEKWELVPNFDVNGVEVPLEPAPAMSWLQREAHAMGAVWVGFGKALHLAHMRYTKWEVPSGGVEPTIQNKDRGDSPFFFFQHTMSVSAVKVESVGNVKTTINMNVHVRMVNPYKAQFRAGGWEGLLDSAILEAIKEVIGDLPADEIRLIKKSGKRTLISRIKKINRNFKMRYGIEILDVMFFGFDIVAGKELEDALEAKEVNRLQADAAEEKAREITTLATANNNAARNATLAYGSPEAAAVVRAAELQKEALIKTGATTVVLGNAPIALTPQPKRIVATDAN